MAQTAAGAALGGYLRKLWFRTHPDFFQSFDRVRTTNKTGLQTMQELIASSSAAKGAMVPIKRPDYSVSLYYKKDDGRIENVEQLGLYNQTIIVPGKLGMVMDRYERDVRLQAFCDFSLYEVIKGCGIEVQDSHFAAAASKLHDIIQNPDVSAESHKEDLMTTLQRKIKESILSEHYARSYVASFRPNMIFFHPTIPDEAKKLVLNRIKFHLPELNYKLWRDIPILVHDRFAVLEKPLGFIQIPSHFKPFDMINFIRLNSEKARLLWKQNVETMRLEGKLNDVAVEPIFSGNHNQNNSHNHSHNHNHNYNHDYDDNQYNHNYKHGHDDNHNHNHNHDDFHQSHSHNHDHHHEHN